jgi:hypothetical protein
VFPPLLWPSLPPELEDPPGVLEQAPSIATPATKEIRLVCRIEEILE